GQTKTKLGSKDMDPTSGISINKYVLDYLKKDLDDYLHKNQAVADSMLEKIQSNKSLRDQLSGLSKGTKERLKKLNVNNDCLYDCSVHFNDTKEKKGKDGEDLRLESSIFITEGNSASGTITKTRNPNFQAVFSLRGKPMNSYSNSSGDLGEDSISTSARSEKGMKSVYENKVLSTLLKTLNIDDDLDGLRYNKIIIATDADVDGMHIRLLLLTFFLQYYPELVRKGHVYILETPLFRVKDKSSKNDVKTHYCYSDDEKLEVLKGIKGKKEITRFKGLGEISDYEFKLFIGKDIHLTQVQITKGDQVRDILSFFMGKNTVKRRDFIIDNLIVEEDYVDEKDIDEE
ncbi:MAG: toprim domain-containing protein, partial [Paludibacteraceae bacterium]|nr:toprim domain-containing protein [Paludibacteraceae bacterium]